MPHPNLVQITPQTHPVELDLAYATTRNLTGSPLYQLPLCYLHQTAEEHLRKAIELAGQQQLRFKIFDAYRPLEIQQALWNHCPNPDYLSPPETGSIPHCRGVAVDLTLIDKHGTELDMGTGFDHFGDESHHGNTSISPEAQANRFLLLGIMTAAGWDFYRNEWWHYQLFNARQYEVLTDELAGTSMLY